MTAIILDTETHTLNGLPIEIAYCPIQLENAKLSLDRTQIFDQLYSIGAEKISWGSMAVHHILESDLENQPDFSTFTLPADTQYNYAYFPILVEKEYPLTRDGLNDKLRRHGIFPRRYFYPLISDFPMYRGLPSAAHINLPVAHKIADSVLCLPIYPALEDGDISRITSIIEGAK